MSGAGTADAVTNSFVYNGAGDLLTLRDGRGHATSAFYDAYGRVTSRRDANDTEISRYQYDPLNHLTNRWSAAKGTTTYVYDPLGNLLNTIYPDRTIQFSYDELNRLTNMVDAVGATRYSYDHAGLLLTEDGPWPLDTVTSIYTNRLRASLTLQQPGAPVAWQYRYDTAHRLDTLVSAAGMFSYRYPAAGATLARASRLPVQVDLPVGAIVNSYDGMARVANNILRNLAQTTLNAHAYAYNNASQRTRMTSTSAGNYVDYGYDALGQLTNAAGRELSGGALRVQEQWANTYDKAGNLAQRVKNQLTETFVADANDQLTSVSSAGTLTVGGTASPAATQVSVNGQTAALYADKTFAVPNVPLSATALTAVATDGQGHSASNTIAVSLSTPTAPQYDLNGNLLTDGWRTFTYDTDNQLTGIVVTNANGTITQTGFVYDGKARRRIRTEATLQAGAWVTNQTFRYLYDGQRVIQERDANNTVLVTYTRGLDLSQTLDGAGGIGGLLARTHPGNKHFYYHADANGNVTAIVNQNQTLVAQYRYDPFGGLVSQSGPLAEINLYRFSSKEFHPPSGLYYYGYRFYDPNLQRWLNRDPSGSKDGPNLFAFVHNGPINAFDTWGLEDFSFSTIWLCANRYGFGYVPSEVAARIVGPNFYTDYAQGKFEYNCITADSSRVLSEMVDYVNRRVKAEQDAQTLEGYEPPGVKGLGASDEEVKAGVNLIEKLILIEGVGSVAIVTGAALALLTSMEVGASGAEAANLGSKLQYVFGRATGSAHNIERSQAMLAQLEKIGIRDNPASRDYISSVLSRALEQPGVTQANGRILRESLVIGPDGAGALKMQSIWDGNNLVTVFLKGL